MVSSHGCGLDRGRIVEKERERGSDGVGAGGGNVGSRRGWWVRAGGYLGLDARRRRGRQNWRYCC